MWVTVRTKEGLSHHLLSYHSTKPTESDRKPLGSWLSVLKLLHKWVFTSIGIDLEHSGSSSIVESPKGCFLFLCLCPIQGVILPVSLGESNLL